MKINNEILNSEEIKELQNYFLENIDPLDIKNEKLKKIYSDMLLEPNLTMEIMSIIINDIDISQLEGLINEGITFQQVIKNKNKFEFITDNLYYILNLPINNPDMLVQIENYVNSLMNKIKRK